jgi:heptosyltransferase-2
VYAGLLKRARVVVANDTGPGHIAAAVGAPLLSVLGPTDAERYRPWGAHARLVQAEPWPDDDAVQRAFESLLDEPR